MMIPVVEQIKTAKRIRHSGLDSEIDRLVKTARANMKRAGVCEEKANSDDDLIIEAIVAFALAKLAETPELQDKYEESYKIQIDELRKSEGYRKCTTTSSSSEE